MAKDLSKCTEFAQSQLESYAREQGMKAADATIKAVGRKVQSKFSSGDLPDVIDVSETSNAGILDTASNSITNNTVWLVDKCSSIANDIRKFASGDMATSDFVESTVERISGFVAKAVKGVTIVTVGIGTLGVVPVEWIGQAAGYIVSKTFCAIFSPLVNHFRKCEARDAYERLHGFYEEAITQMNRQRELFERTTAELFRHRQNLIDDSLARLDSAFSDKDINRITAALAPVVNEFGGDLKFKTFEDFNEFMLNSNDELIL